MFASSLRPYSARILTPNASLALQTGSHCTSTGGAIFICASRKSSARSMTSLSDANPSVDATFITCST